MGRHGTASRGPQLWYGVGQMTRDQAEKALSEHLSGTDEALLPLLQAAILSLTRQVQQLTEVVEGHENLLGLLWDDFRQRRPVDKS